MRSHLPVLVLAGLSVPEAARNLVQAQFQVILIPGQAVHQGLLPLQQTQPLVLLQLQYTRLLKPILHRAAQNQILLQLL